MQIMVFYGDSNPLVPSPNQREGYSQRGGDDL